ncbi:MAG: LysM peptidoglycan-binding domain-containing protein [Chloroflexota bacterium]
MDNSSQENSSLGEWIRFGILAIVMLGAVLVVALSRPFVANRVVPAFLTPPERHEVSLPIMEDAGSTDAGDTSAGDVESMDTESAPAEENAAGEGAAEESATGEGDGTTAAGEDASASNNTSTEAPAAEAANTITHVIQPGESLFVLAQRYNVTVEQIVEANNISNPNRIAVGDELAIPQP